MTLRLTLLNETPKARLYSFDDGERFWVPRSVCKSTVKFPPEPDKPPVHEVQIEDWWWEKYENGDETVDKEEDE